MTRPLPIALTLALLAGCECRGKGSEPDAKLTPAHPPAATVTSGPLPQRLLRPIADQPRSELLTMLGRELSRIRATTDQDSEISTMPDLKPLVGVSSGEIQRAVGVPDDCPTKVGVGCVAPPDSSWRYIFYNFPTHHPGGGPELILEFGTDYVCRSARWLRTQ